MEVSLYVKTFYLRTGIFLYLDIQRSSCTWLITNTGVFLVTGTLIRGAKTWQEDTGALRGKPLKYNLYGVAAVGIAVRGCVGRPLSLEIGDCPSCRLVRLLV